MRPVTDLGKLHSSFQYRLIRLRRSYASLGRRPTSDQSIIISYSVIELDNLILRSLRQFTISSLRGARTKTGHRITTSRKFGKEEEIAAYILSILNVVLFNNLNKPVSIGKRNEIIVRDPRDLIKVFSGCGATNINSLQSALSLNSGIFRDLVTVRNFYAHRNDETWNKTKSKANDLGFSHVRHADDLVLARKTGAITVFDDWCDDAELFFDELTK